MAIDPNSIDPETVRKLIIKGLHVENGNNKFIVEQLETSSNPEIAKHELEALKAILEQGKPNPEIVALIEKEKKEIDKVLEEQRLTLQQAIDEFIDIEKGGLAPSSKRTYKYRLQMLAEQIGPTKGLGFIRKPDIVKAQENITKTAPHNSKRITAVEGRLNSKTIDDFLILWRSFFDWCIRTDRYIHDNPVQGLKPPSEKTTSTGGADSFDQEDLEKIFHFNNFKEATRPHQYFVPLLALYTGARANELAQLRISDFVDKGNCKCLKITNDGEVRTKNEASIRTIPIHHDLIKLGLLDYIDDLKSIKATRLFPYLPLDPETERREKNVSRDANALLKKIGVWVYRRKTLHSFRDTLITHLADKKVDPAYRKDYVGHSRNGTEEESYIKGQKHKPEALAEKILPEIDFKLKFEGFEYQKGKWNAWLAKNICD